MRRRSSSVTGSTPGLESLRARLAAAKLDELVLFTCEHWTNFFLDHISPFCIGRADKYVGPVEPWLKIAKTEIAGDPELATAMLEHCYANDLELRFRLRDGARPRHDHSTALPGARVQAADRAGDVQYAAAPQPSVRRGHSRSVARWAR